MFKEGLFSLTKQNWDLRQGKKRSNKKGGFKILLSILKE